MAKTYKAPGVYLEEVAKFPPSVAPVETAIPIFIGCTEFVKDELLNLETQISDKAFKAKRISSLLEYESYFGAGNSEHQALKGEIIEDIQTKSYKKINVTADKNGVSGYYMYYSVKMFYANGGGPCYILSTGDYSKPFGDEDGHAALEVVADTDEPTIIVFTDRHVAKTENSSGYAKLYNSTLAICAKLKDRIAVFDSWIFTTNIPEDARLIREEFENVNLKYGAVYYPWLTSGLAYTVDESKFRVNHIINGLAGIYDKKSLYEIGMLNVDLYNIFKAELQKLNIDVPPSGAVVGIISATDRTRGVWKAPANVSLNLVKKPVVELSKFNVEELNIDSNEGKSINSIKTFIGKGAVVWGARSLAGNDNEWRYISTTRFCNFVEKSVRKSAESFVFEPNDANTWVRIKGMCENFLIQLWRTGALLGNKPEQSFYVKVGLNSSMTANDILEGKMILEVGLAVTRPAEFIIVKLSVNMIST